MSDIAIVRCGSCGATNRVPREKLAQGLAAKCGRCKEPLPRAGATPLVVTDGTFAAEVERSPVPVLVDAWAAWCGPCRMLAPVVDELAAELAGQVRIRSIPTLLVIAGGREVDRIVGVQPKHAIRARLDKAVAATRR
jgi:thioredoxin 2